MGAPILREPRENPAVVLIGLENDGYLDRNPRRLCEEFVRAGLETYRVGYDEISTISRLSRNEALLIILCFPHRYWDEHCEVPGDTGLYGTAVQSFHLFRDFFVELRDRLAHLLSGRRVSYLIDPDHAYVDRDKVETARILRTRSIQIPFGIETRQVNELVDRIQADRGVFIKCRYGAEGKGITYLSAQGWWTNYKVSADRLGNHDIHETWPFVEITGRTDLLKGLLQNELIIEQEIVTQEIEPGSKFDLRAYVSAGEVPHLFLRVNRRDSFVTNISQGARAEHQFDQVLTEEAIRQVKETALASAEALNTPFVGIDLMFDIEDRLAVVEAQVFTDYPDIQYCNLPKVLSGQIRRGLWDHAPAIR